MDNLLSSQRFDSEISKNAVTVISYGNIGLLILYLGVENKGLGKNQGRYVDNKLSSFYSF